MNISRLRAGLSLTVTAAAVVGAFVMTPQATAFAAPGGTGTAAPSSSSSDATFGDPPLPSYPGLPSGGAGDRVAAAVSTTPVPCADNGTNKTLSRSQVVARAQSWLAVGGVPYSQERCYRNANGDYRTDCSGFVSMAWGLGRSGSYYYTGNLDDVSTVIARSALQPGDALLRHENNPHVDHVALFLRWEDAAHTRPVVIEQTGSSGTIQRAWSQSNASYYTPVRYDHISDGNATATGLAAGDVTGDGRSDLVARKPDGTLWLYGNGGNASAPYTTAAQIGSAWGQFTWFLAGNVTDDGRADLVAARPDGALWLYANSGDTAQPFTTGALIGSDWQNFTNVTLADVTGDGRADLVATRADGALWLYANSGDTAQPYTTGTLVGSAWQQFTTVVGGDVTGDMRADLVARKADGTLWLYTNSGAAAQPFTTGALVGTGWEVFDRVQLGDVTGDRRADITASRPDGTLWLYTNSGAAAQPYTTGTQIGVSWHQFA